MRLFGIPESEIAETLRQAEEQGIELGRLEVTTCLKRGEIEVVTRYEPDAAGVYEEFERLVSRAARRTRCSRPTATRWTSRWRRCCASGQWTIAVAESCTGGELTSRLTGPAGASEYVKGGVVVYANEAKVALAGVERESIEEHGAVSEQVARALAEGVRARMDVDVGVGVTGVAGPGGGTERKPVGLVWLSVAGPEGASITRSVNLPGGRADIRDRTTTVALHMVRRLLGESDG